MPRVAGNRRREGNNADVAGESDAMTFEISCIGQRNSRHQHHERARNARPLF
jgi:hypothetical protein